MSDTDRWESRYHDIQKYKKLCAITHKQTGGICVVCCTRKSEQIHHSSYRKSGDRPLVNIWPVCVNCHTNACHSTENWIYNSRNPVWKNKNTPKFIKFLKANAQLLR